ncbi:SURF1-like protein [Sphaerisporangium rufum]|uniref:SURF1-like protein n=1 Tax=Sphaerisporangium rufum TaxID=1381558 RepID=A0A919R637_9ACTN|nr:SURF1 family protein [Sphaerisporangium rufum]GII80372.1 SURF1-like protein [Sphaerisporangium rufum]
MYRFLLKPRWLALHLLVLLLIPAFVFLGRWQYGRYEDRSAASELASRNLAAAAVPLTALDRPGADPPAAARHREVTVAGRYDPSHELVVRRRVQNGRVGYYALTPLITAEGAAVLVNRGWVPMGATATAPPRIPPPAAGQVALTGRLRQAETPESTGIRPLSGLPAGQIMLIDTPAIGRAMPYPLFGGYVELVEQRPAAAAAPAPVPPPDVGGRGGLNLAYAVQWWVFIAIAIGGWFTLIRREARDLRAGEGADGGAGGGRPAGAGAPA